MTLERRAFLRHVSLGAAGLGAAARLGAADEGALPDFDAARPESFWAVVKSLYPISRDLVYLNSGGLGPAPALVLAKAAEVTRELQAKSEHGHERLAGARADVARFLGAQPAEIAFVRNATEGNAIVAAGLALRPGDEVIFESHAHPGGAFPWLQQARLRGIAVRTFVPDAADPAGNLARIAALFSPRTRVVQVSHVTAPTGLVMPVEAIARWCRERGAWFHIDGAQSAGLIPVSLVALGCDSYATSGHKWLGAPLETGVLFVRRDRMDEVAPVLVGAHAAEVDAATGEFRLARDAMRYEYGTRNAAAILGLAAAARLQERIGRERIAARCAGLAGEVRAGLERVRGVEVLTPSAPGMSTGMITFRSARVPHDRLFTALFKEHGMRCRPVTEEKLNAVRVSTHIFNTPAECDALVRAVGSIVAG